MTQVHKGFSKLSKANAKSGDLSRRWKSLCEFYLPIAEENSIWRFNREADSDEPRQGWKIHVSATILEACDLFEKVAPVLISRNARFKAPKSLKELIKINSGLQYGYWQVGKFITIYPSTEAEAVRLARRLHILTSEFSAVAVPFDERYLPRSSVFYRYGAFAQIEIKDENGQILPVVQDLSGKFVYDDRFRAVPEWLSDPFRNNKKIVENNFEPAVTPLTTTYKVFRAITQRGKGGTYQALDLSVAPPRLCIVKEGRRHGEVYWNGQDGRQLVENEFDVLSVLGKICKNVPQIFSSFEAERNFYLVMEYVEGRSLRDLIKRRRRRFSVKRVLKFTREILRIIEEIHQAGWIWNDCKPANLIVMPDGLLRPIDFEGAYPANQSAPFDWKSKGFSKSAENNSPGENDDFYAFGAVIYFLLTGKFYDPGAPSAIKKLRRNVPELFAETVENLLGISDSNKEMTVSQIDRNIKKLLSSI